MDDFAVYCGFFDSSSSQCSTGTSSSVLSGHPWLQVRYALDCKQSVRCCALGPGVCVWAQAGSLDP